MGEALHYEPVPGTIIPYPGSAAATQKRNEFLTAMGVILGDTRLLWTPNGTDTTTSTESSRNAGVITWDATVAARYSPLGSGWSQSFAGTSQEGDIPDADIYSFGDGAVDRAFSIVMLLKQTTAASVLDWLTRIDNTTGSTKREWEFFNGASVIELDLYDESAGAYLTNYGGTIVGDTWTLAGVSSDGSGAGPGVIVYQDGARKTTTHTSSGTYVAMENTTTLVRVGRRIHTSGAGTAYFIGSMGLIGMAAKCLSPEDMWDIHNLCQGFFGVG